MFSLRVFLCVLALLSPTTLLSQTPESSPAEPIQQLAPALIDLSQAAPPSIVLTPADWQRIEDAVVLRMRRQISDEMIDKNSTFEWHLRIASIVLAFFLAGFAWFGYGKVNELRSELERQLELRIGEAPLTNRISVTVNQAIDHRLEEIEKIKSEIRDGRDKIVREQRFFGFRMLVRDIESEKQYSQDDLDELMNYIIEFQDLIRSRDAKEAQDLLRAITGKLFRSNRVSELRRIEDLFPELVVSDLAMRNRMIEAYTLKAFEHYTDPADIERFAMYRRAAWEAGYGETALAEDLLMLYRETDDKSKRAEKARTLLRQADRFDANECAIFLNSFAAHMNAELLSSDPRPRHREIEAVGLELFKDLRIEIERYFEKVRNEAPNHLSRPPLEFLAVELSKKSEGKSSKTEKLKPAE